MSFKIPAILFSDPLGLVSSFIIPFSSQYLNGIKFYRMNNLHFYHFGSVATKNGKEGAQFAATEHPAAEIFMYKWGIAPQLFENNSHRPKGNNIKGINF